MNKEEAEEYAKNMTYRDAVCNALHGKCVPYRKATFIKLYELFDRLEQEPCDAVDREAVLDLCDSKDPEYKVAHFKEDVECLPPVTPQPKIGHWIVHRGYNADGFGVEYSCSECNEWNDKKSRYCPNCGAKMENGGGYKYDF